MTSHLLLLVALGGAIATVQQLARLLWRGGRRIAHGIRVIEQVHEQVIPNGGTSLRDAVNRVEEQNVQTLRAVSDLRARSRLTMATMQVGFFTTDENGGYTYVSAEWLGLAGLTFNSAMGVGWLQAIATLEERERVLRTWIEAFDDGRDFDLTCRFLRPDGTATTVRIRATPVRIGVVPPRLSGGGLVVGYVGTVEELPLPDPAPRADRRLPDA